MPTRDAASTEWVTLLIVARGLTGGARAALSINAERIGVAVVDAAAVTRAAFRAAGSAAAMMLGFERFVAVPTAA